MALPEVEEVPHFEKVSFRVQNKIFATYDSKSQLATIKLTSLDQSLMHDFSNRHIYPVPNKWGQAGWTVVEIEYLSEGIIIDCIKYAYATVAPSPLAKVVRYSLIPPKEYIVNHTCVVRAPIKSVWRLLTHYKYVKEWDELPDSIDLSRQMNVGDLWQWELPESHSTRMKVLELIPEEKLSMSLYVSSWPLAEAFYDIRYEFNISAEKEATRLSLEIGDFGVLSNGSDYYQNSLAFAENMTQKVQKMAIELRSSLV